MRKKSKFLKKKIRLFFKNFLSVDKFLLSIILFWTLFGFFVFSSASLGLMANPNLQLSHVLLKQILAIVVSLTLMFFVSQIRFTKIVKFAPWFYVLSLALSALVFVPGIGFSSGGASRWVNIAGYSLQPGELLKLTVPIFTLYLLLKNKTWVKDLRSLIIPAMAILPALILLLMQPDTSTSLIVLFSSALIYFFFGAPWKNIALATLLAIVVFTLLVFTRPYVKDRILTFAGLKDDPLGSSYQVEQSLIAIGSGGLFGKGFGQGIQKFGYLPEPVGDSIFATFAEEFGFLGVFIFLVLLLLFVLRSFNLAKRSSSFAASIMILSLSLSIFFQTFVNIAAMSKIMPLTGLTLPLFSLGGTSILTVMLSFGVILSASKAARRKY